MWFTRKQREVAARVEPAARQPGAVKSAADCAASHTRAAEGSFREREIRLPR